MFHVLPFPLVVMSVFARVSTIEMYHSYYGNIKGIICEQHAQGERYNPWVASTANAEILRVKN